MKINKLFHWLYALLMLLPIFAIGLTCAVCTFNPNILESFSGDQKTIIEKTPKYETNEVNSYTDIQVGNIYHLDYLDITTDNVDLYLQIFNWSSINLVNYQLDDAYIENGYFMYNENTRYLVNGFCYFEISLDDNSYLDFICEEINLVDFYFVIDSGEPNEIIAFAQNNLNRITASDWNVYQYTENTITEKYLDNIFYYSVDKVSTSPFFAWANTSFLVVPFQYIFNLFGIASNSPLMLLLSYWLSVSIIWLVFDLIMYVPLLAHRWIDKGMVD